MKLIILIIGFSALADYATSDIKCTDSPCSGYYTSGDSTCKEYKLGIYKGQKSDHCSFTNRRYICCKLENPKDCAYSDCYGSSYNAVTICGRIDKLPTGKSKSCGGNGQKKFECCA